MQISMADRNFVGEMQEFCKIILIKLSWIKAPGHLRLTTIAENSMNFLNDVIMSLQNILKRPIGAMYFVLRFNANFIHITNVCNK